MAKSQSEHLFSEAKKVLVGGVNSPARAFKAIGCDPIFMKKGVGPYITSVDDKKYIDYVQSWGPLILGHAHPNVIAALTNTIQNGTSFGTPTEAEITLACMIRDFLPSMEKIRFVNSGTEATMSAIRLARGATKKRIIIKCMGSYHGHVDGLLVSAGSGALTLGTPNSAGVLEDYAKWTHLVHFNDYNAMEEIFNANGNDIAAVILEPVCGNMGVVLPKEGYLSQVRALCDRHHSLLIFDEVMTGFRVGLSGAQGYFSVRPDITCLGKVIGGGLPCGAYGGSEDLMSHLAPDGEVYQAGTLSGNPLVMSAGIATLRLLKETEAFETAERATQSLVSGISDHIKQEGAPVIIQSIGTMFTLFFTDREVSNYSDVNTCDLERFKQFYMALLDEGIYFAPSQFEANFVSAVHTPDLIEETLKKIIVALRK